MRYFINLIKIVYNIDIRIIYISKIMIKGMVGN